jgi:hypothetical protein
MSRQRPRLRPPKPRARPQVELLEVRDLLATGTFGLTPLVKVSDPDPLPPTTATNVASNSEVEPQIAVDPRTGMSGNAVAVWQQDRFLSVGGCRAIVASVSTDANADSPSHAHWSAPAAIPGFDSTASGAAFARYSDPWVTITPSGDVYAVALAVTPSGPFPSDTAVLVIKGSITGGVLSWDTSSLTTLIHTQVPAGLDPINPSNDKEMVVADPTDKTGKTVYVVWDQLKFPSDTANFDAITSVAIREDVFFSRTITINGVVTWTPARNLTNLQANESAFGNEIVVQPNGDLVDVFTRGKGSGDQEPLAAQVKVGVMRSTDHGATWSNITTGPAIEVIPVTDPDTGATVRDGDPLVSVAADPEPFHNGRLFAVWADGRFSGFTHDDVALSESDDGGLTWSDPIKVNQTRPTTIAAGNQQAFTPAVAVNSAGTVAVTYYDFRNNDASAGVPTDYWLVHASSNFTNPASWVPANELRLTNASFNLENAAKTTRGYFLGDYEGLAAAGSSFYSLFAQAGASSSDPSNIWFRDPPPAPMSVAPSSAPSATAGPTTDAPAVLGGAFVGSTPSPVATGSSPAWGRSAVGDQLPTVRGIPGAGALPAASAAVARFGGGTSSGDGDTLVDTTFSDGGDDPLSE